MIGDFIGTGNTAVGEGSTVMMGPPGLMRVGSGGHGGHGPLVGNTGRVNAPDIAMSEMKVKANVNFMLDSG